MSDTKNYIQLLSNINYYAEAETGLLSSTLSVAHETISSLITTIESQNISILDHISEKESNLRSSEKYRVEAEKLKWELKQKDLQLESQKEEIEKVTADRDRLIKGVTDLKKHLASEGDFHAWHIVTITLKELQDGEK